MDYLNQMRARTLQQRVAQRGMQLGPQVDPGFNPQYPQYPQPGTGPQQRPAMQPQFPPNLLMQLMQQMGRGRPQNPTYKSNLQGAAPQGGLYQRAASGDMRGLGY